MQKTVKLGDVFSRLTVLEIYSNPPKPLTALCRCTCGKNKIARTSNLLAERVRSCGCLRLDVQLKNKGSLTHGHSQNRRVSPTYKAWFDTKNRCINPRCRAYSNYGGKGIQICDRWLVFECFLEDMGERPNGGYLQRKNKDGDFEINNCEWGYFISP